jgi:RNA polymerase sigma-70 factor (ECF subfamily)
VRFGALQQAVDPASTSLQQEVEQLCTRYAGLVFQIARRYGRDESEADDIAQQIWERVIALLPEKNPEAPIDRWIVRVSINVAREARNRGFRFDRLRSRLFSFFGVQTVECVCDEPPSSDWVTREVAEQVWSLPGLEKEVVLRRIYDGLSLAETAAELDVAVGTVKASFHRANRKLAKKLEPLRELWERNEI